MNEVKCIICYQERPEELFSGEHIFPDSIGGTLVIKSVCKDCNSKLGDNVDSHLVNHWLIQGARQTLKIPGKSGKIPNPLEKGTIGDDPTQQVHYIFDDEANPQKLYVVPNIKRELQSDGTELVHIVVDKSDKDKVPQIINKMMRRKGLPELTKEEIEQSLKEEIDPSPTMHMKLVLDTVQYKRAILKIAYELAYYWLGEKYLEDNTGMIIRNCMLDEKLTAEFYKKYPIKGRIEPTGGYSMLPVWDDEPNTHIAFLKKANGKITCFVKVFSIFEGMITVSDNASNYPEFEDRFISINPQTGVIRESSFLEEVRRLGEKER